MRKTLAAVVGFVAIACSACGGGRAAVHQSHHSLGSDGTVVVHLLVISGSYSDPPPDPVGTVVLTNDGTRVTGTTAGSLQFDLSAPPGTYRASGQIGTYYSARTVEPIMGCRNEGGPITVKASKTIVAYIGCGLP